MCEISSVRPTNVAKQFLEHFLQHAKLHSFIPAIDMSTITLCVLYHLNSLDFLAWSYKASAKQNLLSSFLIRFSAGEKEIWCGIIEVQNDLDSAIQIVCVCGGGGRGCYSREIVAALPAAPKALLRVQAFRRPGTYIFLNTTELNISILMWVIMTFIQGYGE